MTSASLAKAPVEALGRWVMGSLSSMASFSIFCIEVIGHLIRGPIRMRLVWQACEFVGNRSLGIILLTGFFVGAVFGLQIGEIYQIFAAEGLMGASVAKALAREIAPMFTGFLLAGRAGSAMTAEVATMRVGEQIDAMEAMGVNPISYLVVPRFIALVLMLPLLSGIFVVVGTWGAYVIGAWRYGVDEGAFMSRLVFLVENEDIWSGIIKALIFGALMAIVSCRYGLSASGGAKGVGLATTNAVVMIFLGLLAIDVIITYFDTVA